MTSALLVIDVQNIYTEPSYALYCENADKTLAKINRLIRHFKRNNEPVIYIRHIHKEDGSDTGHMFDFSGPSTDFDFRENTDETRFPDSLLMLESPNIITKNRYSSFLHTRLEEYLHSHAIDRVAICGFMTNFCCESAARDAHDRDFYVDFILDATGTLGVNGYNQKQIRKAVAAMLGAGFATVHTTKDYLKG